MLEPLTPQDVQAALDAAETGIQVIHLQESAETAPMAAAALGTELGSIVKSLLFMADEKPVLVLTAGDQRVHDGKLATHFDIPRKRVKIATPEQCIEIAGYKPGGVPPLGHRQKFPILIDQTLSRFETVYAAAGWPETIFPIPYAKLVEITGGTPANVIKD